jgi:hypothetical protein
LKQDAFKQPTDELQIQEEEDASIDSSDEERYISKVKTALK